MDFKEQYKKWWNKLPSWIRRPINRLDDGWDDLKHKIHGAEFLGYRVDISRFMANKPTSGKPIIYKIR